MSADQLLTVAQVAEMVPLPKRTVQYAITAGHLQARKLPGATGAYLISPADLDAWLATRTRRAS